MDYECIDDRFSTTRRLTRTLTEPDPCLQLPGKPRPANTGGLRTRGLYKAEGSEPIVTVITVAYNCASSIEETMLSVLNQTYSNIEYVVIDGGSTDGTLEVIRKYDHAIDYWLSEPDRGIYDAINKGVRASTGQWLNCMNVKDALASENTVQTVVDTYIPSRAKFIYSDVLLTPCEPGRASLTIQKSDHTQHLINHQAAIYHKSLHREYGLYVVAKGMTISDYLFFCLIDPRYYLKAEEPIAKYDITGISQSQASLGQMYIVDHLINGMPRNEFMARFAIGYFYREARAFCLRMFGLT